MSFRENQDAAIADYRYAVHALRRRPSFATIAILTMALGIGAATAMFAVVDNVLVRPLKHKDADRLVTIWGTVAALKTDTIVGDFWNRFTVSYEDYEDWRHLQTVFEETAIFQTLHARFAGEQETRTLDTARTSANFFSMLGTRLFRGRSFDDDEKDAVIVTYEFWNKALGADANAIGRKIVLDNTARTIVGILPSHFDFAGYGTNTGPNAELWQTLDTSKPSSPDYQIIGRLRRGMPLADAERETDGIFRDLRFAFLNELPSLDHRHGARLEPLRDIETREARTPLILLLLSSGLLLLIACGNVANLLLGEARGREHEVAMRSALGASTGRIVRQLIIESLVIAALGGILGCAIAWMSLRGLVALAPPGLPRINEIGVDGRIFFFITLLSAASGILFGLAPALALAGTNLIETLKNRGQQKGSPRSRSQALVVVAEISICFLLLVGAGLLARSLMRLNSVDKGFNSANLLGVRVALPRQTYEGKQIAHVYRQLSMELNSLPGVSGVTAIMGAPFEDFRSLSTANIDGKPAVIETRDIWPNYFEVVGGRIIEGRTFTDSDFATEPGPAPRAVIINKTMARQFWPGESAIDKRLEYEKKAYAPVVAVTDDVRQLGLGISPPPMYYTPMAWDTDFTLLIRTTQNPFNIAPAVRNRIQSIDKNIAIDWMDAMDELVRSSLIAERYRTLLIVIFALSAVSLAVGGLYGVMSRYVAYRNRELGIRLAIGAQPRRLLMLVLWKGLMLTVSGILFGTLAAVWSTRVLSKYLFGISALDAPTYVAVGGLLAVISLAAVLYPARRASRIDPVDCLRAE